MNIKNVILFLKINIKQIPKQNKDRKKEIKKHFEIKKNT